MGLHDRLKTQNENGNGFGPATAVAAAAPAQVVETPSDPYAELKTRIHHEVIGKLGPELFKKESAEDLSDRVYHAVTERLALDRTPLTREEHARSSSRSRTTSSAMARWSRSCAK